MNYLKCFPGTYLMLFRRRNGITPPTDLSDEWREGWQALALNGENPASKGSLIVQSFAGWCIVGTVTTEVNI